MHLLAAALLATVATVFCQNSPQQLDFLTFEQIQYYLQDLKRNHKSVRSFEIGRSVEGRSITGISIKSKPEAKYPAILVDAGIHGREWVGPVVAMYTAGQLLGNASYSYLLDGLDWYIIPLLNPDGYVYSMKQDRLWRKNRAKNSNSSCYGVDLNRNFGYVWGGPGSSPDPCSLTHRGPKAFSEPEAYSLAKFIWSVRSNLVVYVTLHSPSQSILYPWGFTEELPPDWRESDKVARRAAAAMYRVNGTKYDVGSTSNVVGDGAGGSDDWAKGAAGIKIVSTMELPGLDYPSQGLAPRKSDLPILAREGLAGIVEFAEYAKQGK